jgi:AcrR family transcriptional regulator
MIAQDGAAGPTTQLSRQQILHATALCLRRDGYDATTIRRIAGELSCSVGSIYRYFTDKRELLLAVTQCAFEPVAAAAENRTDLEASLRLYHATAAADPSVYKLMFWLASMTGETITTELGGTVLKRTMPPVIERTLAGWSAMLGGESRARRCWATLHGAIMLGLDASEAVAMSRSAVECPVTNPQDAAPVLRVDVPAPPEESPATEMEDTDARHTRWVPDPQPQIVVKSPLPSVATTDVELVVASLP